MFPYYTTVFFLFSCVFFSQDKQALEQQQVSNRLQISALQSKLDETRHCFHDNARDPTQELRDALDAAQQSLHTKEQEVCVVLPDASASVVSRLDCACCITLASVPPSGANMASSLKLFSLQSC